VVLAADYKYNQVHELEGELHALKLVDLDREGLGQYREQLVRMGITKPVSFSNNFNSSAAYGSYSTNGAGLVSSSTVPNGSASASYAAQPTLTTSSFVPINNASTVASASASASASATASASASAPMSNITDISNLLGEIFAKVDRDGNGSLTFEEAEKLLVKLNSRLGRRYAHEDVRAFFETLSVNNDGTISLNEFRRAFDRLS